MIKNESIKSLGRLSVTVDPELHRELKIMAAKRNTTVSNIVEEACREMLDKLNNEGETINEE